MEVRAATGSERVSEIEHAIPWLERSPRPIDKNGTMNYDGKFRRP